MGEQITITEALADLKTTNKRIAKQREVVMRLLYRQQVYKDPYEKEGGSAKAVAEARQSISDLEARILKIRRAITEANLANTITILGVTRTIQDWLVWRRDVAPLQSNMLNEMVARLSSARDAAKRERVSVVDKDTDDPKDVIVNINEAKLDKEREEFETILGTLDGQLSLKNATIVINL